MKNTILFFGSTTDSVIVLKKLSGVVGVVTQPSKPVGRKQIVTPTPVEMWAKQENIPVYNFRAKKDKKWLFEEEHDVVKKLSVLSYDTIISASFGQKIPLQLLHEKNTFNIHPSLLPRWRGADPVPWAILSGDGETGVTVQTISEAFDKGSILAQVKRPISETDTSDALRTHLFSLGGDLLLSVLSHSSTCPEITTEPSYARRFTREDGYVQWDRIVSAINGVDAVKIHRLFRALHPWPGIFSKLRMKNYELRVKILTCHMSKDKQKLILDTVQLEGKNPVSFAQFKEAYLS